MKSNKLKSNSSPCANFSPPLEKYIKKLLFHKGKLETIVSLLQWLWQGFNVSLGVDGTFRNKKEIKSQLTAAHI